MGVETEYAVKGFTERGVAVDNDRITMGIIGTACRQMSHLKGRQDNGMYLGNGARFYNDQGHPEYSTPECDNPWDVVRYILAGDQTLLNLSQELVRQSTMASEVPVYKGNIDYSGGESVWGCHESYQHKVSKWRMRPNIIPHLVTRIIFTGAGGFNSRSPGLEFMVSPRVAHLVAEVSCSSTEGRGIYHQKDEPLSLYGFERLHLLCGESNYSHLSTLLKIGTTALIVRLIEAGENPGNRMVFSDSVEAMNEVAADYHCRARLVLKRGQNPLSALDIQRQYLDKVEACLGKNFMPDWAPEICVRWREVLDQLSEDPSSLDTRLDWRIKHKIFSSFLQRRGFSWEEIGKWNQLMGNFRMLQTKPKGKVSIWEMDKLFAAGEFRGGRLIQLNSLLNDSQLTRSRMEEFLALRRELFELDTKSMQLGPQGLFCALDQEGVIDHQLPGVTRISEAITEPPEQGRAHVRGMAIQELAGKKIRVRISWDRILDFNGKRKLDLTDPFVRAPNWAPMTSAEDRPRHFMRRRRNFLQLLEQRGL